MAECSSRRRERLLIVRAVWIAMRKLVYTTCAWHGVDSSVRGGECMIRRDPYGVRGLDCRDAKICS